MSLHRSGCSLKTSTSVPCTKWGIFVKIWHVVGESGAKWYLNPQFESETQEYGWSFGRGMGIPRP
ncbi:MAG: hypothetical protein AB8G95_21005 [Anaerolineae bacterium]